MKEKQNDKLLWKFEGWTMKVEIEKEKKIKGH
jgi:hypothetical protein